MIRLKLT